MRLTSWMQPISPSRCPWKGSSPVVSVSSTISRTFYIPAPARGVMGGTDESPPPLRHCSYRVEDRTYLGARRLEAARRIHDKIRAAALFVVGHLLGQDRFELFHGHAGAFEHARALHFRRRRYHHHRVDPAFSAGLEQERNVEH